MKPTKPNSSYTLFMKDYKLKLFPNPENKVPSLLWNELPLETQEKYKQLAKAQQDEYQIKLQAFYEQFPEELEKAQQEKTKQKERKILLSSISKNAQPFIDDVGYVSFCVGHVLKLQNVKPNLKVKQMLSKKWEVMLDEEKEKTEEGFNKMQLQIRIQINFYDEWINMNKKKKPVKEEQNQQHPD